MDRGGVLVTGASGFIGAHVVRALVTQGRAVYALVRPTSDLWRLRDVREAKGLTLLRCDLTSDQQVEACLEAIRPELCVHLAWRVDPLTYLHSLENLDCLSASVRLAARLASAGCRRFIGVGTCLEYDRESGAISEAAPTMPRTLYAASKCAVHLVLERLSELTGMSVVWLRLFYLYGPHEDPRRLVPSVIGALLNDQVARVGPGDAVRDVLHIEDVAAAIWAVAQSPLTGPVNIGSGTPRTVREIVERIARLLDRPGQIAFDAVPARPEDPPVRWADTARVRSHTGWMPRVELDEGLRDAIAWWRGCLVEGRGQGFWNHARALLSHP